MAEEKLSKLDKAILSAKKKQQELCRRIEKRMVIVKNRIVEDQAILDSLHKSYASISE